MIGNYESVEIRTPRHPILKDCNLKVNEGDLIYIVGAVGSGKTSLLRTLYGELRPKDGIAQVLGTDMMTVKPSHLPQLRRKIGMDFQDFHFLPDLTVGENLDFVLRATGWDSKDKRRIRIIEVLEQVNMAEKINHHTYELSGGEKQRVSIARAILNKPQLILADEPISALDVSLQAQVLNLLMDLQDEFNLSMLFVAHDLAVVRQIADYIMIMYAGHILEEAPSAEIYANARHPYTQVLLQSAPSISKGVRNESFALNLKIGDAPDPSNPPSGCVFHTRCVYADERCMAEVPEKREIAPGHFVCCHKAKTAAEFAAEGGCGGCTACQE